MSPGCGHVPDRHRGRSVVVTGAGSGIGAATAARFAAEGARVVVADIDRAAAAAVAATITAEGGEARAVRADVSRPEQVEAMIAEAVEHHDGLHVLHNNAWWGPIDTMVTDIALDDWAATLDVTLGGTFLGCRYAIPAMRDSGGGAIVNMASTVALMGARRLAAYAAAKGAVVSLTRSIATDYGREGIRANAVAPGVVHTPATVPVLADPARAELIRSQLLVDRIGEPADVAAMVSFLASDDAAYVSGQVYPVDGGRTIV